MHYPGEIYQRSVRKYLGLNELDYPFHDRTVTVTMCGRACERGASSLTGAAGSQVAALAQVDGAKEQTR
jgi:hypothetical protein